LMNAGTAALLQLGVRAARSRGRGTTPYLIGLVGAARPAATPYLCSNSL